MKLTLYFFICTAVICISSGHTINNTDTLTKQLLKDYNKNVRGTYDLKNATVVNFSFHLTCISDFDEVSGKLSITGFFTIVWKDERITWNSSLYNNTKDIYLKETDVWKPLIVLKNSHDKFIKLGNDHLFVYYLETGIGTWFPGGVFTSVCRIDIYKYPFDVQNCYLEFYAWGFYAKDIYVRARSEVVDLSSYRSHGIWNVDKATASVPIRRYDIQVQGIVLNFRLSRRPMFYIINMILPICVLGFLNIFVFILPADSGERISYSVAVLLALAVFQTIASDNLPNVSEPSLSLYCIKLLADIIFSSLITIASIISQTFYTKAAFSSIPKCFVMLVKCMSCRGYRTKNVCRVKIRNTHDKKTDTIHDNPETEKTLCCECSQSLDATVTWVDVGKALDIIFILLSTLGYLLSNVTFFVLIS